MEVKVTGGASVGMARATWPFATLKVTKKRLELNATIIGNLVFKPSDITSIEVVDGLGARSLKINHKVANYKNKVVFHASGDIRLLLKQIEQTGFLDNREEIDEEEVSEIEKYQSKGGFPLKTGFSVIAVIIWNLGVMYDFYNMSNSKTVVGAGVQFSLSFVIAMCLLILFSSSFRSRVMKEGRSLTDIKKFIYALLAMASLMFISFSFTISNN